tara:strand:+ start:500 stop:1084 length:585 start_codon:yes stop_codon:yes gene_type:complete
MSELRTNRIVPRDGLPAGSSGGIIQVKQTVYTNNDVDIAVPAHSGGQTGNYVTITQLNCTITPTRSDSKILVSGFVFGEPTSSPHVYCFGYARTISGGSLTAIARGTGSGTGMQVTAMMTQNYHGDDNDSTPTSTILPQYLDSPNTTSAITYHIQIGRSESGNQTFHLNTSCTANDYSYDENGLSMLTLMEVSG